MIRRERGAGIRRTGSFPGYEFATQEPHMYKQILIAVDGSETSSLALEEALKLAKEQGARVVLLNVFEPFVHAATEAMVDLTDALRQEGEQILAEALQRARENGIEARTVLIDAGARRIAEMIVEEAQKAKADLIAMGTHGRRGIEHLVLGSVAEGVARRTNVPLLLIHSK